MERKGGDGGEGRRGDGFTLGRVATDEREGEGERVRERGLGREGEGGREIKKVIGAFLGAF